MFARVKAALLASNLLEKYEKEFEAPFIFYSIALESNNSLEDSMVDHCLANKEDMHILADVIPSAGHRLKFITEFRKLSNSSAAPSQHQNVQNVYAQNQDTRDHEGDGNTNATSSLHSSMLALSFNEQDSCINISSSSTSSQVPRKEFKTLVQEAYSAAVKEYDDRMNKFLSEPDVSYDSPNLQSVHQENKTQALATFIYSYNLHRAAAFKIGKIKNDNASQNAELQKESEGEEFAQDLQLKQNELLEDIEKHFKSIQEKLELEHSRVCIAVSEAEKLYTKQMTKFLDTCLNESELLEKEAGIKQETINYLNYKVQNSFAKPKLRQQLNKELDNFISNWFKSQLELFQLKRDEDEIVVRETLMTAKTYYNEEMEKHFQSTNYLEPSTLSQLDEQILSAAMKNALEKHNDLKITPSQQAQLKEAMKIVFKKYKEKNLMRKPTKTPAIGIDLGTTYSCVAVVINGKPEVIRNENGNNTTPSYVAFQADGSMVSGDAAKDQSYRNPQNTIFDAKRLIGRKFNDPKVQKSIKSWPFEVVDQGGKPKIKISNSNTSSAGKTYHPEEISARVLRNMKKIAEDYLGTKVESAVVTVPALFNDSQRQATKDAAEIAGLKVLRIINEPTAAAIAYRLNRMDDLKRNVVVFDLGGGTFDVVVLKIMGGEIEVKAVHGDTHLGGEDFDAEMIQKCIDHYQKLYRVDLARGRESKVSKERFDVSCRLRRIRNECERQKRVLSSTDKTVLALDVIDSNHPTLDLHVPFTREMFESINQKYFDKCIEIVGKVLREAKMTKSDINDVVLVGGSTRIPKIQKMLSDYFEGKALSKTINPDEAVAVGAAIQACILNGEQVTGFENSPLKLMDVTPFSIGIENSKGNFVVQIPKNSKIPFESVQTWCSAKDMQTAASFTVFEGEDPIASKNYFLGTFNLTGIPPRKAGEEKVKLTTKVNKEGILSVEAICKSNSVTNDVKIKAYKDRLTREEIERAKASH